MGIVRRIALLILVLIIGVLYMWGRAEQEHRRADAALKQARAVLDSARALNAHGGGRGVFLSADELAALRRAGLTDPVSQLRSDLEAHGSLIPVKGVLGGKMGFYDRDDVVLLPGGYVYAPGEDGHILVHAILRYQVEPGGKIHWTMVEAKKD